MFKFNTCKLNSYMELYKNQTWTMWIFTTFLKIKSDTSLNYHAELDYNKLCKLYYKLGLHLKINKFYRELFICAFIHIGIWLILIIEMNNIKLSIY
jgi:hypothetical protein